VRRFQRATELAARHHLWRVAAFLEGSSRHDRLVVSIAAQNQNRLAQHGQTRLHHRPAPHLQVQRRLVRALLNGRAYSARATLNGSKLMMFLASNQLCPACLPEVLWILHRFLPGRTVKTLRWRMNAARNTNIDKRSRWCGRSRLQIGKMSSAAALEHTRRAGLRALGVCKCHNRTQASVTTSCVSWPLQKKEASALTDHANA
jgi:hypothetical protein